MAVSYRQWQLIQQMKSATIREDANGKLLIDDVPAKSGTKTVLSSLRHQKLARRSRSGNWYLTEAAAAVEEPTALYPKQPKDSPVTIPLSADESVNASLTDTHLKRLQRMARAFINRKGGTGISPMLRALASADESVQQQIVALLKRQ